MQMSPKAIAPVLANLGRKPMLASPGALWCCGPVPVISRGRRSQEEGPHPVGNLLPFCCHCAVRLWILVAVCVPTGCWPTPRGSAGNAWCFSGRRSGARTRDLSLVRAGDSPFVAGGSETIATVYCHRLTPFHPFGNLIRMVRAYLDTSGYGDIQPDDVEDLREAMARGGVVVLPSLTVVEELLGPRETNRAAATRRLRLLRDLVGFDGMLKQAGDLLEDSIRA
jgi:hypothetical protein